MAEPAGVRRRARAWAGRDGDASRCRPSVAFPDAAHLPPATVAALHGLAADVRAGVAGILQAFAAIFGRIGLKHHESAGVAMSCPVLVAQVGGQVHGLIQCCSCLKSSPFLGEFAAYNISHGRRWVAVVEAPFVATLPRAPLRARAFGSTPLAVPLQTETELAVEMAKLWAGAWCFHPVTLDDAVVATLSTVHVAAVGPGLDLLALQEQNRRRLSAARAVRLFRRLQKPVPRRRRLLGARRAPTEPGLADLGPAYNYSYRRRCQSHHDSRHRHCHPRPPPLAPGPHHRRPLAFPTASAAAAARPATLPTAATTTNRKQAPSHSVVVN